MRLIFWLLLALVLLSPLPFGARDPWAWSLIAVVVAALVLAWAAGQMFSSAPAEAVPLRRYALPALLYFGALGWALVQTATWTPEGWHHPVWKEAAAALGRPVPGRISIEPLATETAVLRLASWAGIFFLAMQLCRSGANARIAVRAVAVAAFVYGLYGLVSEFAGGTTVLWFAKEHYLGAVTSTFHYKNAYAGYAALGAICATALFLRAIGRALPPGVGRTERIRAFFAGMLTEGWPALVTVFVTLTALALADSRGAVIAVGAGLFSLVLILRFARSEKVPGAGVTAAVMLAAGIGILAMSGGTVLDKFTARGDVRTELYRAALDGIAQRPLTGTGLATFRDAYREYRVLESPEAPRRAHNSYLDNAWGLGIPATVALNGAILILAAGCAIGAVRRNRNGLYPAIGLAAAVTVGVHALFDFTLQFAAVSSTFALILGVGYAQSWSTRDAGGAGGRPPRLRRSDDAPEISSR